MNAATGPIDPMRASNTTGAMIGATSAPLGTTGAPIGTTGAPIGTTGALTVIRGLDPRIETGRQTARPDGRVKPDHDVEGDGDGDGEVEGKGEGEGEGKRDVEGCFPP